MSKTIVGLFVLTTIAGFSSGCGKLEDRAKDIQKALKVPVILKTTDADACAKQQVVDLETEFAKMDAADRAKATGEFRKYQSLTVNATVTTQTTSGSYAMLVLLDVFCDPGFDPINCNPPENGHSYDGYCQQHCQVIVADKKMIADGTTVTGADPQTKVKKGAGLEITSEASHLTATERYYSTYSRHLFGKIDQETDAALLAALKADDVELENRNRDQLNCGTESALGDLYP